MTRYLIPAGVLALVAAAWAAGPGGQSTGFLKVDTPGLVLNLDGGKSFVVGKPKEIPVPPLRVMPLPAGSYKGVSATLHAKDKAGNLWNLETKGRLGKLAKFEIAEGETTTLTGGGPLRVSVRVGMLRGADLKAQDLGGPGLTLGKVPSDVRFASVVVRYVGQGDEEYFPQAKKGTRPSPLPVVHIFDENGTHLIQGLYKRGGVSGSSFYSSVTREREGYLWPIPPGFTGRISVKVVQDLGPFVVEPEKEPKLHSTAPKGKGAQPPAQKGP